MSFLRLFLARMKIVLTCVNTLSSSTSFLHITYRLCHSKNIVSMLFRAPRHFYGYQPVDVGYWTPCVNALPSSTSFLLWKKSRTLSPKLPCVNALPSSTSFLRDTDAIISFIRMNCVNALPSSTSFLQRENIDREIRNLVSMLFRAPRHFYIMGNTGIHKAVVCVNALPSSTSFLPKIYKINRKGGIVSMLFRAPRHFYIMTYIY